MNQVVEHHTHESFPTNGSCGYVDYLRLHFQDRHPLTGPMSAILVSVDPSIDVERNFLFLYSRTLIPQIR